jgi:SAM-dependent methyltransferase
MSAAVGRVRHGLDVREFIALFDAGQLSLDIASHFSLTIACPDDALLADPCSDGYRAWVMSVWSAITGRPDYRAEVDEAFDIPADEFLPRPWPYSSGSAVEVGRYRGGIAWMLRVLDPQPGDRVVEFGAGWGLLALELAMLGCDVTAVDLNPPSVNLLQRRAAAWGVSLDVAQAAFLDYDLPECDLIIFFEAFHHCDRPFELLDGCRAQLRPGGRLVFLADAIYDNFSYPWGVRPDGSAVYMARYAGWLELGFERTFFTNVLHSRGFEVVDHAAPELGAYGSLTVATLAG